MEAYYQQAARTAGTTVQASLDVTLKNSTVCAAIAGNATARNIMKSKYSSSMTSYIDSNWSEGLNTLNFNCGLACYAYHAGNPCIAVSGGWQAVKTRTAGTLNTETIPGTSNMYIKFTGTGYYSGSNQYEVTNHICAPNTTSGASGVGVCLATRSKVTGWSSLQVKYILNQNTSSLNQSGGYFAGTVTTVGNYAQSVRQNGDYAIVASGNTATTLVNCSSTAKTIALTKTNSGYIEFAIFPRFQLGGGGATDELYVYSVKLNP